MGKKSRHGSFGTEPFYVVTMDNGKSSGALESRQDIVSWLDENFAGPFDEGMERQINKVSQITVKKKYRVGLLTRLADVDTEIVAANKRLEQLAFNRSQLEAQIAARPKSDSPEDPQAM